MAEDPELTARIRIALLDVPDVTERRMFGSVGFLVNDSLRIAVGTHSDHVAMVRTGSAHAEALARSGVAPAIMRGKPMSGWVFLEREAIESDEQIFFWIQTALDAIPGASPG